MSFPPKNNCSVGCDFNNFSLHCILSFWYNCLFWNIVPLEMVSIWEQLEGRIRTNLPVFLVDNPDAIYDFLLTISLFPFLHPSRSTIPVLTCFWEGRDSWLSLFSSSCSIWIPKYSCAHGHAEQRHGQPPSRLDEATGPDWVHCVWGEGTCIWKGKGHSLPFPSSPSCRPDVGPGTWWRALGDREDRGNIPQSSLRGSVVNEPN